MEELECMKDMIPEFQKMLMRAPYDVDKTLPYYRSLAKDILKHKNRLGGNFVIAQAVSKRIQRDCMKEIFGSQGIFVLLHLSKETNAKRIEGRHEGLCQDPEKLKYLIETMNGLYDTYEDTQPEEKNCITVHIDPDDRPQDVMDKITIHVEKLQR